MFVNSNNTWGLVCLMSPKSRRREVHPGGPLRGLSPCAEPAVPPRPGTQRRPKSRRANGRPLLEEIMVLFLQVGLWECGSRQMAAFLGIWRQEVRMRKKGRWPQAAAGGGQGTDRCLLCWEPPLSTSSSFPPSIISLSDCSQGPAPSLPSWLQHKWGVHFPGSVCCIPSPYLVLGNDQKHS